MPVSVVPAQARELSLAHACERGDIISGWLVKLTVSLALIGIAVFDLMSVLTTQVTLSDQAAGAAREAVDAMEQSDWRSAHPAAESFALEEDASNVVDPAGVLVSQDGSATVTVQRTAATLVLFRLGPLADWADRSATITAAPLP